MGLIKTAAEVDKIHLGDYVQLSRNDSAQIMTVSDVDGRQSRLDGTVTSIAGN